MRFPDPSKGLGMCPHVNETTLRIQYARLLARLVGDSIERVASRDISIRSAWSILPLPTGLSPRSIV
jgi:hypothetical protein